MLIELHMLKNYPATNLNRDETGSPKTCYFGGSQRGRISSQCLKRTWRTSDLFKALDSSGIRSRSMPEFVSRELMARGLPEDTAKQAQKALLGIVKKDAAKGEEKEEKKDAKKKEEHITKQVIFFSDADIKALANVLEGLYKKDAKAFKDVKPEEILREMEKQKIRPITLDIALFGRMVTSDAFEDVEAAMQVAHAVSTHAVNLESDYFTAVDDLIDRGGSDDSGAAMIGDIDYNSCCYYLYAALDTDQLKKNLQDSEDALEKVNELVPVLLRVMAMSNPGGKQNTFAGHVLPEAVLVEFKKEKIPLNYVNAFAEPVNARQGKVVANSIEKLISEIELIDSFYKLPVVHRAWLSLRGDTKPQACEKFSNFDGLADRCGQWARE